MKVEIRKATTADAVKLTSFHEDGNTVKTLMVAFEDSLETWVGLIDDEPVAIWGVITPNVLSDDVYVWLTGSKLIELHPLTFARWSREALKTLDAYPKLRGLVLCDFTLSITWLQWLGFTVSDRDGRIRKFWRAA